MARLAGRIAVVTGGGAGIGRACALAYAAEGATIVIADNDEASAARTVEKVVARGGQALARRTDVGRSAECRGLIEETVRRFGRVDILHANAGIEICKPVWETTDADWQRVIDVNLSGAFYCCRDAMSDMRRRAAPGVLVLTASPHAFVTARDICAYAASKGGMVALMRALAIEGAPLGIRVNALLPGAIATPMLDREMALAPDPAAQRARFAAAHPAARLGTSEEVAQVAVFVVSDDASFMTGSCVSVDGGLMATLNSGPAISYTEG